MNANMDENSDSNEVKEGFKLDPISLEQWMKQLKYQEEYSNFYNKLGIKQRGIEAVSHLSNTKSEIINLSEEAKRKVIHYLKLYKEFFQVSEDDSKQVKEIYRKIMKFIEIEFPSRSKGSYRGINEEKLTKLVKEYCNLKGISRDLEIEQYDGKFKGFTYSDPIDVFTYSIYREKEELEHFLTHLEAVETVIDTAIYRDYPKKLNKEIIRETQKEKDRDKGGRKEIIQEKDIEDIVTKWIEMARNEHVDFKKFIWDTPKRKGDVHYNRIARHLVKSEEVKFIDQNTYKDIKVLADKVASIVKKKGI